MGPSLYERSRGRARSATSSSVKAIARRLFDEPLMTAGRARVYDVRTMLRHAGAPLTLVAILGLALLALAFVPSAPAAHAGAGKLAYWVLGGHG